VSHKRCADGLVKANLIAAYTRQVPMQRLISFAILGIDGRSHTRTRDGNDTMNYEDPGLRKTNHLVPGAIVAFIMRRFSEQVTGGGCA
jgi:hypothetical protein